jgi:hypothetical protein
VDPRQCGPRRPTGRAIDFLLVERGEPLKAVLRIVEKLVADVVGGDREAGVGGLVGDLGAQHARAQHRHVLDVGVDGHFVLLSSRCAHKVTRREPALALRDAQLLVVTSVVGESLPGG